MYDVITIGSATTDVFIKSSPELIKHKDHLDLAYLLGGKILIKDLIFTTGGGATNTAVGFSRLGLKTGCIACLGNDSNSNMIIEDLKKEKVDFLGSIKKGNTGYSIILSGFQDRTILAYKGNNDFLSIKDLQTSIMKTNWLYMSSMLGQSFKNSLELAKILKKQGTKIALNLSLYLAKKGLKELSSLLEITDILILNKEEAEALSSKNGIDRCIKKISQYTRGIIVITDGPNSVHVYDKKGIYNKNIRKIKPLDTTGAGDAFGVGFVYGIIKGKGIKKALEYGHKESISVLKHIGAKNNLLRHL